MANSNTQGTRHAATHYASFVEHDKVLAVLKWANDNMHNHKVINNVMEKARLRKGLDAKEASLLLLLSTTPLEADPIEPTSPGLFDLARDIKSEIYGKRVVLFAPLYLSNHCVNGCTYCPYHAKNTDMPRIKLSQEDIKREVQALQDMGHKRIVIETGEHPVHASMDYILECMETIYSVHHKNGAIRRINVNIAAASVDDYKRLAGANVGTYILFQETYHRESYQKYHPYGPKSNFDWHTLAMDRAMQAGLDDIGIGVLFGLYDYRYEFAAMLMHAQHLEDTYGVGPHTISVPRIRRADGVSIEQFSHAIDDDTFTKIVACLRISVPYTGIIISTRENEDCRKLLLDIGVSQISGGSLTSVGGYAANACRHEQSTCDEDRFHIEEIGVSDTSSSTAQFETHDNRTLQDIVHWLLKNGHMPSFCTACYQEGRTGTKFMEICKAGKMEKACNANAVATLREYMRDYGNDELRAFNFD